MSAPAWARALFRLCLRSFPADHRRRFGEESAADFAAGLEDAARRGRWPALRYALAACSDAVGAGLGERRRRRARRGRDGGALGGIAMDVRVALRGLVRSPAFTAATVGILALGVGANAAVFSALRTVLLDPAPFPHADRLAYPKIARRAPGESDTTHMAWSWAKYRFFREATAGLFDAAAPYTDRPLTLSEPGDPVRATVEMITPAYLDLLGVEPALGRNFADDEAEPGRAAAVTLLSHELWTERWGADPGAVGERLVVGEVPYTVVGVLPRGFRGLTGEARAWIPFGRADEVYTWGPFEQTQAHWFQVLARRRPGVAHGPARARVRTVGAEIEAEYPMADPGEWVGADLFTLEEVRRNPGARASVLVLAAAAGLVLLVAVANVAGLLLARATRRRRERAVRRALGAGRWRVVRGALVESLALALLGGAAGVAVALWGADALAAAWPSAFLDSPDSELRVVDVSAMGVDATVLAFAVVVSVLSALAAGLAPALAPLAADLTGDLKEGTGSTRGRRGVRGRRLLVASQLALAVVLTVGAGLMTLSMVRLQAVEAGFDPEGLLTFRYVVPESRAPERVAVAGFHRDFAERLRALPGVEDASVASVAPVSGFGMITRISAAEGHPPIPEGTGEAIGAVEVDARWLDVLGARLSEGRPTGAGDDVFPPEAVVVNRTAARSLFGDENPLGRTFQMGIRYTDDQGPYRVVGVVEDLLHSPPDRDPMAVAYLPLEATGPRFATASVRTGRGDPYDVLPAVREVLASMAPGVPLYRITSAEDILAESVGDRRVVLALLTVFAVVALLLAATGVYGVVAFTVADRRRELGLRMALGARAQQVSGIVVREGMVTGVVGVAVGLAAAWAGAGLLSDLLYRVGPRDPAAFAAAAVLLLGVALLASWIPARRAARADPSRTLRSE